MVNKEDVAYVEAQLRTMNDWVLSLQKAQKQINKSLEQMIQDMRTSIVKSAVEIDFETTLLRGKIKEEELKQKTEEVV